MKCHYYKLCPGKNRFNLHHNTDQASKIRKYVLCLTSRFLWESTIKEKNNIGICFRVFAPNYQKKHHIKTLITPLERVA